MGVYVLLWEDIVRDLGYMFRDFDVGNDRSHKERRLIDLGSWILSSGMKVMI